MVIRIVARSSTGETSIEERGRPSSAIVLAMKLVEAGLDVTIVDESGQELTARGYQRRIYPSIAVRHRRTAEELTHDNSPPAAALSNANESGARAMNLKGADILVVEDDFYVALDIADTLDKAGAHVIGPIPDLYSAREAVSVRSYDAAVVDLRLGAEIAYPLLEALAAANVPVVIASAYSPSEIARPFRRFRHVEKPYEPRQLVAALTEELGRTAEAGA